MDRALFAALLPAALLLAASPAAAATCTWLRMSPEGYYEGDCTLEWTDDGAHVTFEARDFQIRERDRQGQWATATLNGAEAMRYEIDRTRYSYATSDLNEFLEVQVQ